MHNLVDDLKTYLHPRVAVVGLLGFFSGLPLLMTASTLTYWLASAKLDYTSIGLFALVGIPYTLKFAWAPFVDSLKIPFLTRWLGQRRSWIVFAQLGLISAFLGLALCDPAVDLSKVAGCAFAISVFSATQDIAIDAYRIETLEQNQYAAGSALGTFGYRIAMLVSGAGAIVFADLYGWSACFIAMALLMTMGVIFALTQHEPFRLDEETIAEGTRTHQAALWIKKTILEPFVNFMKHAQWGWLLVFVLVYRASDGMLGFMSMPFYKAMGFTAGEIASAVKIFGMIATFLGVFLGGLLATRYGNLRMLFVGALLQALSNGVYIVIYLAGHEMSVLYGALLIENVTGGIAGTAFIAYLCQLCSLRFAATQYSLLAALAVTPRIFLAAPSGVLIDTAGWIPYFLTTILVGLPAIGLSWYLLRKCPGKLKMTS